MYVIYVAVETNNATNFTLFLLEAWNIVYHEYGMSAGAMEQKKWRKWM